jgi:hypothetical protein
VGERLRNAAKRLKNAAKRLKKMNLLTVFALFSESLRPSYFRQTLLF